MHPHQHVSGPRNSDTKGQLSFTSIINAACQEQGGHILPVAAKTQGISAASQIIHGRGQVAAPAGRQEPFQCGMLPSPQGESPRPILEVGF